MLKFDRSRYNFQPDRLTLFTAGGQAMLDDYTCRFSACAGPDGADLIPQAWCRMLAAPFLPENITLPEQPLSVGELARILAEAAGLQITESADSIALTRPGAPALPVPDDRVLRELFPYSPAERLIPHQLILPAGDISSLVLLFHGGGGDPSSCPADFRGMLPMYADRYHCAFLCPDAFIRNSTFGCRIPPQGILPEAMAMFPDTPEDKLGREASEDSILQLTAQIREQYGLTEKPLYLAGNSMGGMGSFYLGAGHPDLVRAIAPAGAAPAVFAFDYAALKGMPIFFTAGELDHHGYGHLAAAADHMASLGLDLTFRSVPGGTHGGAWVEDPDSWLSFLVSHN